MGLSRYPGRTRARLRSLKPRIQRVPKQTPELEAACLRTLKGRGDALVDFDMYFHLWRQNHLAFVKRMIGAEQRSVKGDSIEALEKLIVGHSFFPALLGVCATT